jgi:hypothetical protein
MSERAIVTGFSSSLSRPEPGEYAPYYDRYISLITGSDILGTLDTQRRQMMMLLFGTQRERRKFSLRAR